MSTEGNAEPLSNQWLRRQAQQFGKGARRSTPYLPTKSTTPSMINRGCLPRFQLQNRTEPVVVLKTLKGGQKGESGSHVTLSGSLQACCMAPSPEWTAGLDWPCSKLEVQGWDMGLHDPGRGPRSQDGFCTSGLSNEDPDAPLKRASRGGVPPGLPPRVCPQLALGKLGPRLSHQKLQIRADWAGGLARFDRCAGIASVVPSHTFHQISGF